VWENLRMPHANPSSCGRASVGLLALLAIAGPGAGADARRTITETDLFRFTWIAGPRLSPDGTRVAFTRVIVDEKRAGYETSIWVVRTDGSEPPARLTNGKHDSGAVWSPDGRALAFVRGGAKDASGKPQPAQIAILSLGGGEARTITDLPKGAGTPVWSPDSKRIAFLSSTTPEDIEKVRRKKGSPDTEPERESDVHVITRGVYRSNDAGYLDPKRHAHIWMVEVPASSDATPEPRQLTSGNFDEYEAVWAPDGSRLYFLTRRVEEPYYETPTTDIYSVAVDGGDPAKVATVPMAIRSLALSPDGQRLAFHGEVTQPVRSYSQPDVWVLDIARESEPRNLTAAYDFDMGGAVGGDNSAPRGGGARHLQWSADGNQLYDTVEKEGRTFLARVDAQTGVVAEITRGDQAVLDFSASPSGRDFAALISSPVMIGDLFRVSAEGDQHRITDLNQALWSELDLTPPEEIRYTSFDGKPIQGWIQKPPAFDPQKKYPLILNIHGGPHGAYGWVFDHEFQWMAAKGYVVLYINPRGSTSYGQDFGNIIQYRYPGDDYKDLMIGVDRLLERGYIDSKKLGVTGGSGGGVLTNWTVTHTDRFAAAVSQRDISDWASWWYTADFTMFQPEWFKTPPFQGPQEYASRSSITLVDKIHTPILFVLGEADYRTPPGAGGEQLFRALKFLKRPTAMVMFPRESHELSRSGEPWHRIERLQFIVGWFDKWMMGIPHPEFDIPAQ
jgi:dipeptidyl aminopeptidase/acylaminoacyl peptidase